MTPSPKSLRSQLENGQHACGGERVMLPREVVAALLDRIESLEQTAQRRLNDLKFYTEQLAAMTAARDEACDIANDAAHGYDRYTSDNLNRIEELRRVGKENE